MFDGIWVHYIGRAWRSDRDEKRLRPQNATLMTVEVVAATFEVYYPC